jgi:hypothetical protein
MLYDNPRYKADSHQCQRRAGKDLLGQRPPFGKLSIKQS